MKKCTVSLFIHYSNDNVIHTILDTFEDKNIEKCISSAHAFTTFNKSWIVRNDITEIQLALNNTNKNDLAQISRVPRLNLICKYVTDDLDLSPINTSYNKVLQIVLSEYFIEYVDLLKATIILIQGPCVNRFHAYLQSLGNNMTNCRIQQIIIDDFHYMLPTMWLDIIRWLPKKVTYTIQISDPSYIWFIDALIKNDIDNIQYYCCSKETFLAALMCKKCFKYLSHFPIVYSEGYNNKLHDLDMCGLDQIGYSTMTSDDVYDMMEVKNQMKWFPIKRIVGDSISGQLLKVNIPVKLLFDH